MSVMGWVGGGEDIPDQWRTHGGDRWGGGGHGGDCALGQRVLGKGSLKCLPPIYKPMMYATATGDTVWKHFLRENLTPTHIRVQT